MAKEIDELQYYWDNYGYATAHTATSFPRIHPVIGEIIRKALPKFLFDKPTHIGYMNADSALMFYAWPASQSTIVGFAGNATDYDSLCMRRPKHNKFTARKGDFKDYAQFYHSATDVAPFLWIINVWKKADVAIAKKILDQFSYQRPVMIFTTPELASDFSIATKITIENHRHLSKDTVFKDEEDLFKGKIKASLATTILVGIPYSYGGKAYNLPALTQTNVSKWQKVFDEALAQIKGLNSYYHTRHSDSVKDFVVPHLDRIPKLDELEIKPIEISRKLTVKTEGLTKAFLTLDNESIQVYDTTQAKPAPLTQALLSKPNLLSRPIKGIEESLENFGYTLKISPSLIKILEKKRQFYAREGLPLYPVTSVDLLAYYKPGKITAKDTVLDNLGKVLWLKGEKYEIVPGWERINLPGGSEPLVDENGKVVGEEQYQVLYSILQLKVQSETGVVIINENEARGDQPLKDEEGNFTLWKPMLDDFLQAFDLPKVDSVETAMKPQLEQATAAALARFPHLKGYQVDAAARNALKRGGLLGSEMGAGKTHQALAVLFLRNRAFNLLVVPTSLVNHWYRTLRRYGMYTRKMVSFTALRELEDHFDSLRGLDPKGKRGQMAKHRLGQHTLTDKEVSHFQEFYVTTPEFLGLGDNGNRVYDPWVASYVKRGEKVLDKNDQVIGRRDAVYKVTCTRSSAATSAQELKIGLHQTHQFGTHIQECPKCKAKREEGFTFAGYCNRCGFSAWSYKGHAVNMHHQLDKRRKPVTGFEKIFGQEIETTVTTRTQQATKPQAVEVIICERNVKPGDKKSTEYVDVPKERLLLKHNQKEFSSSTYPAYKRIRKIFGSKLIDELHLIANLDSQKGHAVYSLKTKDSWGATGTLSKGYVTDIESALCHVHRPLTPPFPFAPWDRSAFREQFITQRQKTSTRFDGTGKTISTLSMVPEASNPTRLRSMLVSKTTAVPEHIIETEWKLPKPTRIYQAVSLSKSNTKLYYEILNNLVSWYKGASTKDRVRNAFSKLWELRSLCDGEEKIEAITKTITGWRDHGYKFVVVAPTHDLYRKIVNVLKELNIRYIDVDEKTPAEDREERTMAFADPTIQCVVSRTKLVSTGLNTLVHATHLLIAGLEYHPATVRQMEKRLCRPGQMSDYVEIVYPIVRMEPKKSVEEKMLQMLLRKEEAINEITKGKVRFMKTSLLIEAAMEKQGAIKVLESVIETDVEMEEVTIEDVKLDSLFDVRSCALTGALREIKGLRDQIELTNVLDWLLT